MAKRYLNPGAIESSLRAVQKDFPRINKRLKARRDALGDEVVENMLAGYRFLNGVLGDDIDLFANGNSNRLLELNTLVLCGSNPERRKQYAEHIQATEKHFYEDPEGGVRDIMEWYRKHRDESPWKRAAGIHVRVLSQPQLFIEGNHRTGALIMSYILVRHGQPPFVLTVENARGFFDPSTLIKDTKKHSLGMLFQIPRIKKNFAHFLKEHTDRAHLG